MFPQLEWDTLESRCNYFKSLLIYKSLNDLAPLYLRNKFSYISENHMVNTSRAAAGLLALPPCSNGNDTEYFRSSFGYSGVEIWNRLDYNVRMSPDINVFKNLYKQLA